MSTKKWIKAPSGVNGVEYAESMCVVNVKLPLLTPYVEGSAPPGPGTCKLLPIPKDRFKKDDGYRPAGNCDGDPPETEKFTSKPQLKMNG